MSTFASFKDFFMKILQFVQKHRYALAIVIFLLVIFCGNNPVRTNANLKRQIKEKEMVVRQERAKITQVEQYMERIQRDPMLQEEHVRKHYNLKKRNEDIFHVVPATPVSTEKK